MSENSKKTVIYMIRHGEPAEEFRNQLYGQIDVPLSELGKRQSLSTAERLASVPFTAIYSSDLQRAGFLADALAGHHDLPVRRLEVLRERRFGVAQGLTEAQFEERFPEDFKKWKAKRVSHRSEGGESFQDLHERIIPSIEKLIQSFEGGRVAVVGHAGPIRVTLAHYLGMPLDNIFHFVLDYACINVIEFPNGGAPQIKLING